MDGNITYDICLYDWMINWDYYYYYNYYYYYWGLGLGLKPDT